MFGRDATSANICAAQIFQRQPADRCSPAKAVGSDIIARPLAALIGNTQLEKRKPAVPGAAQTIAFVSRAVTCATSSG
jgi:hypothetical protein